LNVTINVLGFRLLSFSNARRQIEILIIYVLLEFFIAFKEKFPEIPIMLTMFQALKPWFVWQLKDWNMCCRYHMEFKKLLNGFNEMRTIGKGIHGTCNYKCIEVCASQLNPTSSFNMCTVEFQIYKGLIEFWTFVLCPKLVLTKWHFRQCLMVECSHCGVHTLKVYLNELETDEIIH
jgi:hypothetical protein